MKISRYEKKNKLMKQWKKKRNKGRKCSSMACNVAKSCVKKAYL